MEQTTIQVTGMSCMGCVNSVKRSLEAVPGVTQAQVSLERNLAEVQFDPQRVDIPILKAAIVKAGFEVA